eukprot:TRINITY_DN4661_c0_g1_i5.p2 TRINITY_DN4661_c0_g1~~TRINITY_DN4661_c0_g1_i5.p2  ORF type:complete len:125 (-),score=9.59 TRINITY_DN4661_c0_g1_i5:18-392(-)
MCIRDRRIYEEPQISSPKKAEAFGRATCNEMMGSKPDSEQVRNEALGPLHVVGVGRAKVGPVSYTHLRAHETRHDLVCRLLLEKKKKTSLQLSKSTNTLLISQYRLVINQYCQAVQKPLDTHQT